MIIFRFSYLAINNYGWLLNNSIFLPRLQQDAYDIFVINNFEIFLENIEYKFFFEYNLNWVHINRKYIHENQEYCPDIDNESWSIVLFY